MAKVLKTVAIIAVAVAVVVFAPQIAGVLASVAGSLGVTVAASAISSALIGMGISMALTAAATMFRKAPSMSQSLVDRLNTSVVPTASRKIVFGTTAGGQDVRFFEGDVDLPSTKKDGYVQVIALASHRINALRSFYVENDLIWQDGSFLAKRSGFAPTNPFRVVTEGKPGNGFSVGTGRYWNSASTFTGCAYYVPFWKLDEEVWESGIPQRLTAIVEGCPLYDPRRDSTRGGSGSHRAGDQNTYAFRDGSVEIGRNPALALLTYLLGWRINGKLVWGMGIPAHRIDFDNFRTYANLCEERVATQDGGTVQRYTVDGIFSTTDSHETVISGITATMGSCKLTDRGGTYCLVGGYDDTAGPKISFTADDLVAPANGSSPYIWNPAPPSRERYNIVRGRFAKPDELYQLADWGDPIEQPPLADGIPRTLSLDLGAVSRAETCQRIAKQFLLREYLTPGMFSATFGPKAFAVEIGSVITLSLPAEGWNNKLFRVMEQAETHDLFFQMTLREEDPQVYAWDREEKPLPASIRPQGYDASATISPANLTLTSDSYSGANAVNVSEVHVSWTPELSGRVSGIQIQSRPKGTDAWTEQAAIFDPKLGMFTFTSNAPGITVEVQARFRMSSAVYSPWVMASVKTAEVITVTDWENVTDSSGTRPADNATVGATTGTNLKDGSGAILTDSKIVTSLGTSADTSKVNGVASTTITGKLNALDAGGFTDTTPPGVPTGLALSSTLSDAGVTFNASWTAVTASDLAGYIIAIKEGSGNYVEFTTTAANYSRSALARNTSYTAKVAAFDKAGNRSGFSAEVAITTARDTVAPGLATGVTAKDITYNGATIELTAPGDNDLAGARVRLLLNGTVISDNNVNVTANRVSRVQLSGLTKATAYSVTVSTYDTSGNSSAETTAIGFTTAGGIVVSDFAPNVSPIQTVAALPAVSGYTGSTVVYYNGELYRLTNGAWSKSVSGADIATNTLPVTALTATNLRGLSGSESIKNADVTITNGVLSGIGTGNNTAVGNSLVTIGSDGRLSGAGGGQVSISGLGFTGDLSATVGDNLLINAALLNDTANWTFNGAVSRVVGGTSDPGNYFRGTVNNAQPVSTYAAIPAGTSKLFFSYWKRASEANQQIAFDLTMVDSTNSTVTNGNTRANSFTGAANVWTLVKGSVDVPSNATRFRVSPVLVMGTNQTHDIGLIRVGLTEAAATVGAPSGTMVGSTLAQTLDSRVSLGLTFADTRNDNQPPSYYYGLSSTTRTVAEFKALGAIGVTGGGTYGQMVTTIAWQDSSGGPIQQEVRDSLGRYWNRYSTGNITWSAWMDTGAQINIGTSTITGTKITDDTIEAPKIRAGAISAEKLLLADTTNFTDDSDFSAGGAGWIVQTNDRNPGQFRPLASAGAGNTYRDAPYCYYVTNGVGGIRNRANMRVSPGDQLYAFSYQHLSGSGDFATVRISWLNANKTEFTVTTGSNTPTAGNTPRDGGWQKGEAFGVAPAGAAYARVEVFYGISAGELWIGMCGLMHRATGELIVDGSITTNKMLANSIEGDRIKVLTLSGDRLVANSVSTNKLAVQSRPLSTIGLNMRVNLDGTLTWDAGQVRLLGNEGSATYNDVSGNTVSWAGNHKYIFWVPGRNYLDHNEDSNYLFNDSVKMIAIWKGGTDLLPLAGVGSLLSGDRIVTGSIDANRIKVNTLQGNQIVSGTVSTAQLAAEAVTATKLAVGNTENVCADPYFRDVKYWRNIGAYGGDLSTGAGGGGWYQEATAYQPAMNEIGSSQSICLWSGSTAAPGAARQHAWTNRINGIKGGTSYSLSLNCFNASNQGINVYARCYNSDGGISGDAALSFPAQSGLTRGTTSFATGPNVVGVEFIVFNNADNTYNGYARVTGLRLLQQAGATSIENGAITTDKLTAEAVTADKIRGGTITGDKFNTTTSLPGTITVGQSGVSIATLNGNLDLRPYGTLRPAEFAITGSSVARIAGGENWSSAYYSAEAFTGGASISGRLVTQRTTFGLGVPGDAGSNADDWNYGVAFRVHWSGDGNWYVGESGSWINIGTNQAGVGFSASTVWAITYDGRYVRWYADSKLFRTTGTTANRAFQARVLVGLAGARVTNLDFTSYADNSLSQTDPAARINEAATTINPGRILIQGGTTLDSWRDNTEIKGSAIKTGSITANKLTLNNRIDGTIGLNFEWNPTNNWVYWDQGYIYWFDDNNNRVVTYINAGNTGGAGAHQFFYWFPGQNNISFGQVDPGLPDRVHIGSWWGNSNINIHYGGTIMNGNRITTGTVTADKMKVGSLSAISANVGTVTAGLVRSTSGNAYFDLDNARIVFNNGSVMKVQGVGFGSSNQFIEWFGPVQSSFSNCSEANATYYLKTDGSAYFGGSLSAGVLKNSVQTTSTAGNASVTTGTFGSNGRSRVVTVGYSFNGNTRITGGCPTPYTPYATVRLYRGTDANGTMLAEQRINGSNSCSPGAGQYEPGSNSDNIGGSFTYTDNTGGGQSAYYVVLVDRYIGTNIQGQSLGVTSVEQ